MGKRVRVRLFPCALYPQRCFPGVSPVRPRCVPGVSPVFPRCVPGASPVFPRCFPGVSPVRPGMVGLRVLLGENGPTPLLRGFRHADVHRVVGSNPAAAGIGPDPGYAAAPVPVQPPHPLTEERTFQHFFELAKAEQKKKLKKVRKPQPKKEKARKAPTPKRTPEEQREARRIYEQTRNQRSERKEAARLHGKKARQQRKENGQCRSCSNPSIPGQTRCVSCAQKHRESRM